jgi:hypothetical protein
MAVRLIEFCCFSHVKVLLTMKLRSIFLLSSLLLLPVTALIQKPVSAIVQQVDADQDVVDVGVSWEFTGQENV